MTQATVVRYPKGTMFFDNTGKPLAGGCLFYFQASTTTPQSVYLDSTGSTIYSSGTVGGIPYVQLNSAGRLENPLYFGSVANYKECLTDYTGATSGIVGANTISPWPEDNIPCATTVSTTQQVLTGTLRAYVGTVAPSGYCLASGLTIGNPSSSATGRANSDTQALFVLLWNSDLTNSYFVVGSGRGASALTDFNANKSITLPDLRGRTIFGIDNMGGTAANRLLGAATGSITAPTTLGAAGGQETHALTSAENGEHNHTITQSTHTITVPNVPNPNRAVAGGSDAFAPTSGSVQTLSANSFTTAISLADSGSGTAHNNIPPGMALNWLIKL